MASAGVVLAVSDAGAQQSPEFKVGVNDAALRFTPETIKVSKGGTVVWSFAGSTTVHNVVTENDVAADPAWKDFSTPPAGADGEFRYTFKETGVYEYLCDLHRVQGMVGRIEVVDEPVATPEATPRPLITATPVPTAAAPPAATRDTPAPTRSVAADTTAPVLSKLSGARSGKTAGRVKWTLSEPAALTVKFTKGKSKTVLRTVRLAGRAGTGSLTVSGGKLRRGSRYNVQIDARDRAGNRSTARTTVRVGR